MHYQWDFGSLLRYRGLLASGVIYTVGFTLITAVLGLLAGLLIALGRLARSKFVTAPLVALVELFRCTPVLVQLVWFYYALPVLIGVSMSPAVAAVLTLTLYGGSFYAEIIRGGIASVERGQWDAARAIGMRRVTMMRRVVVPQAFKHMLPPLVNQTILQLKNTSLVSILAVPDLLYQGQLITSATYRPLEVYTTIAALYFAILFPATLLVRGLERRLRRAEA